MPYNYPDQVPDYIKNLPEGAQKIFIEVFNNTVKESGKTEDDARQAGWGAVKTKYVKNESSGKWELKLNETFRYITNIVLAEGGNVSEVQLLRTGTFHHKLYGIFTLTDNDLKRMAENFGTVRPKAPTEMVVDYDHFSVLPGGGELQGKAAGWFKSVRHELGKFYATIAWTEPAANLIRNGEFRFMSPEFNLNWQNKETGQRVGPTLLSGALTNRPFLEGMEPVVLSERLASMMFNEDITLAEWDTQYINDLPDSAFALIKDGGTKDDQDKTVPRTLRYLPFKNASGETDLPHLRNALARLEQTDLPSEDKSKARAKLVSAAKEAGVGDYEESSENQIHKEDSLDDKAIRTLLKLGDGDDITAALTSLMSKAATVDTNTAKLTETTTKLATEKDRADKADLKLKEADAAKAVDEALKQRKITPKMKDWATTMYLKDPDEFKKYVAVAEPIGPDLTILGHETNPPPAGDIQLTETDKQVAKNLGVSEDKFLAEKKRIATAAAPK